MSLNEIIEKIYNAAELLDAEALIAESNSLLKVADQLTPRSMDQKPQHDQWCLVFYPNTDGCFIARYHKPLDCFIDHNGCYGSSCYKWLPVPEWKEDE